MMNLVLSGLVGLLLATTVVYRVKYRIAKEAYEKAMVLANQSIVDAKTAMESAKTAIEGYNVMKNKYESMKEEHDIIFDNLAKDPMCLVKTIEADNSLYQAIKEECNYGLEYTALMADHRYDSTNVNYYNTETKEITISMFINMEHEQERFMIDYLNDKYGINLNKDDIRTRFIFTQLHELGHYVDLSNKEQAEIDKDDEMYESVYSMEDGPESWQAYREVPTEAFADKFAVDFMIKHFPELV